MDANNIITIISTVGFPIAMCLLMGWFIVSETKRNSEQSNKYVEVLAEIKGIVNTLSQKIDEILREKRND